MLAVPGNRCIVQNCGFAEALGLPYSAGAVQPVYSQDCCILKHTPHEILFRYDVLMWC
jgi:hypothetical protein